VHLHIHTCQRGGRRRHRKAMEKGEKEGGEVLRLHSYLREKMKERKKKRTVHQTTKGFERKEGGGKGFIQLVRKRGKGVLVKPLLAGKR